MPLDEVLAVFYPTAAGSNILLDCTLLRELIKSETPQRNSYCGNQGQSGVKLHRNQACLGRELSTQVSLSVSQMTCTASTGTTGDT